MSVALLLKLLPLVVMFATNAEGFLIACAVASDVVGILFVLLAAISLLHIQPKFSSAAKHMACDTDKEAEPEINRQAEVPTELALISSTVAEDDAK